MRLDDEAGDIECTDWLNRRSKLTLSRRLCDGSREWKEESHLERVDFPRQLGARGRLMRAAFGFLIIQ